MVSLCPLEEEAAEAMMDGLWVRWGVGFDALPAHDIYEILRYLRPILRWEFPSRFQKYSEKTSSHGAIMNLVLTIAS